MTVLQQYEARLIGESKTKDTRILYMRTAKRLMESVKGKEIDAAAVLAFRDELAATKVESSTMISYIYALKHYSGFLGIDVDIKAPKKVRKAKDNLTKDEFMGLLAAARGQEDLFRARRDTAMLLLMGDGGARSGEVRDFLLKDLDLEAGYVLARSPKGKHDRKVVFGDATRRAMAEWLEVRPGRRERGEANLFVTKSGEELTGKHALMRMVWKLAAEAGITRVRVHPHMLRRYRITELSKMGLGIWDLQAFAGHSSIVSTQEYVVVDEVEMIRQVQALPAVVYEEAPRNKATGDLNQEAALIARLAKCEISEEAFNRAMRYLEKQGELEVMR